jgi:hypothetical protein
MNSDHAFRRSALTDITGLYSITALPPASYRVNATEPGFSATEAADLRVNVSSQVRVDLTLPLAERRESIEVPSTVKRFSTNRV